MSPATASTAPHQAAASARRAPALPRDDRRRMILDAVVPLLVEHGADITSRQIAEAAGIAEGTVFRAFGDKETLLRAAAEQFFDPETVLSRLRAIDPQDGLEAKVAQIITILRERFSGAIRVMAAIGHEPARPPADRGRIDHVIAEIFAPDAAALDWAPGRVMHLLRLLSFASAIPEIEQADEPFTAGDLARIVVTGVATPDATDRTITDRTTTDQTTTDRTPAEARA